MPRLVYVADVMCSWCWGFAPELEALVDRFSLPVEVIVGGLRPGPAAQPLDASLRDYLRATWARIESLTGQPFDPAPLDWTDWTYDTEVPARAVVTVRAEAPERALALFHRLQRAYYAEAVDITDVSVYPDLVRDLVHDPEAFVGRLSESASRDAAWRDFRAARALGVSGFPALFVRADDALRPLALGYRRADDMVPVLEEALAPDSAQA